MLPSRSLSATVNAPRPMTSSVGSLRTRQLLHFVPVGSEIAKLTSSKLLSPSVMDWFQPK